MKFRDRQDAGSQLGAALSHYADDPAAIVIALPRGGVVVGAEIARQLHLPLDLLCPRKIGAPGNPELAIGAVSETGEVILSSDLIEMLQVPRSYLQSAIAQEKKEAQARLARYRKNLPPRQLKQKKVILVDDGIATGSTMFAAIQTVKAENTAKLIVAVPVAPEDTVHKIQLLVDELVVLHIPTTFHAVGQFYERFDQTTDAEVMDLISQLAKGNRS